MARVFRGRTPRGGFVRGETRGQPSDAIRRLQVDPRRAGRLRPRRGAALPAQAQVAAWCAASSPARAVAALGRANMGRFGLVFGLVYSQILLFSQKLF
jgi:hypothetical protein